MEDIETIARRCMNQEKTVLEKLPPLVECEICGEMCDKTRVSFVNIDGYLRVFCGCKSPVESIKILERT